MSLPAYPTYRTSAVPWLERVPSGWGVVPLKQAARVFPSNVDKHSHDGETPVLLCNYTDVYYNDRIDHQLDFMEAAATPDEIRKFTLRRGDTIITKDSETADDIGRSAYVAESLPGVLCGYHLSVIRPNDRLEGRFIKRLFDSSYLKAVMEVSANGLTRVGLGQYALDNLDIPLPPFDEQVGIADFLDRETAKIDALITKQEKLIATLREDRTATITHAVTKGLDPDAEMKYSGVAWLGDIPKGWRAVRLKHVIASAVAGTSVNAADWPAGPDEIGVLKTSCVSAGWFNAEANKVVIDEVEKARVTCSVQADSLIVNRANTPLLVGTAGYVAGALDNIFLSDKLWEVRFHDASASFIHYWTRTEVYRSQISALCVGASSSMQNLAMVDFRKIAVALPPVDQQRAIVTFLSSRVGKIENLIARVLAMIDTLREYRAALITDAVTGRIDVRGLA